MTRNRRRHKTGFGYIGAGNSTSVFNRKANKAFSKTKEQLNNSSIKKHKLKFTNRKLSDIEKEKIKNDIRKKSKRKNRLTLLLSIIILIPIVLAIIMLVEGVLSKYN